MTPLGLSLMTLGGFGMVLAALLSATWLSRAIAWVSALVILAGGLVLAFPGGARG